MVPLVALPRVPLPHEVGARASGARQRTTIPEEVRDAGGQVGHVGGVGTNSPTCAAPNRARQPAKSVAMNGSASARYS